MVTLAKRFRDSGFGQWLLGDGDEPKRTTDSSISRSIEHMLLDAKMHLPQNGRQALEVLRATAEVPPHAVQSIEDPAYRAGVSYHTIVRAACPETWERVNGQLQRQWALLPGRRVSNVMAEAQRAVQGADFEGIIHSQPQIIREIVNASRITQVPQRSSMTLSASV